MKTTFAQTQTKKQIFHKLFIFLSKRQNRNKTRDMKRKWNGTNRIGRSPIEFTQIITKQKTNERDKEQQAEKCRRNVTDLQRNNQIKLILTSGREERPERECVSCELRAPIQLGKLWFCVHKVDADFDLKRCRSCSTSQYFIRSSSQRSCVCVC